MRAPDEDSFRVAVQAFSGPMDLLLHLVREKEVEISDIPIAEIADAFLAHVRAMKEMDLEAASEFLVLAATLMEIKSRLLLPRDPSVDLSGEDDPRWELVQKLLEYRRFKDAATLLEAREALMARRWPRPEPSDPGDGEPEDPGLPEALNPWSCFQAYARILQQIAPPGTTVLRPVEVPMERLQAELLALCPESGELQLSLRELLAAQPDRVRAVGLLLALLELVRLGQVFARQEGRFGTLFCSRARPDAERN